MERSIFGEDFPIKIQLGFLIQIIVIIVGMTLGYQAIRSDLSAAIKSNDTTNEQLHSLIDTVQLLRIDVGRNEQELKDLKYSLQK